MSEQAHTLLATGAHARAEYHKTVEQSQAIIDRFRKKFAHEERHAGTPTRGKTFSQSHFFPVMSICGARGSGKTSALLTFLDTYAGDVAHQSGDILLELQDPHRFMEGDRLMHWFFASIEPVIAGLAYSSQTCEEADGYYRLRSDGVAMRANRKAAQDRAARVVEEFERLRDLLYRVFPIRAGSRLIEPTEERFRSQYLADSLKFPRQLGDLIIELSELHQQRVLAATSPPVLPPAQPPLILFPVDDADLAPEYLDDLLDFLRIIVPAVPRLVLVLTLDLDLVAINRRTYYEMCIGRRKDLGLTSSLVVPADKLTDTVDTMAAQFISKFIPREGRVMLPPLSATKRLELSVPLLGGGQGKPLVEVLQSSRLDRFFDLVWALRLDGDDHGADKDKAVQDSTNKRRRRQSGRGAPARTKATPHLPSPYVELLSGNPRLLEELYVAAYDSHAPNAPQRPRDAFIRVLLDQALDGEDHPAAGYFQEAFPDARLDSRDPSRPDGQRTEPRLVFAHRVLHRIWMDATPSTGSRPKGKGAAARAQETGRLIEVYSGLEPRMLWMARDKEDRWTVKGEDGPRLTQTYLFLAELARPGLLERPFTRPLPGIDLARLHLGLLPRDDALDFPCIHPFGLVDAGQVQGFPLPPWPYPLQWYLFAEYWQRYVEVGLANRGSFSLKNLVINAVWAAAWVSRHGDPSTEVPEASRLNARLMDVHLGGAQGLLGDDYSHDVQEATSTPPRPGAGLFAYWVERGLVPFLDLFLDLVDLSDLTAEQVLEEVVKPVASQNLPPKSAAAGKSDADGGWSDLKARIRDPATDRAHESLVVREVRNKGSFDAGTSAPTQQDFGSPPPDGGDPPAPAEGGQ